MASKREDAPVCPRCDRSDGIWTETTASFVWRRGAWRLASDAHHPQDLSCPCGYDWTV